MDRGEVMNKTKISIGNGEIKLKGDFTGILILKHAKNTDGISCNDVYNARVYGTGSGTPTKLIAKARLLREVWKWISMNDKSSVSKN